MVSLDVEVVKKILQDLNQFVRALCKPIFNLSRTKNNGKHLTKYFANKYKLSMLVTLKQALVNNLPFEEFCCRLLCVKDHLFDDHKHCLESCKQKQDKNYGKQGRYLSKTKNKEMYDLVSKEIDVRLTYEAMRQLYHPHSTQIFEMMKMKMLIKAPKHKVFCFATP